ncbi:MAG: AAA family ATPase [Clostridia bacterium]|nr:AAA family ATPase [Clostridia bacterium]
MNLNKLKINSYGKLKEKEINLNYGINIIYGKNEAGKSTLLNFIVNTFYGISKNKKGKEYSDFEKYLPWSGEEFSGKIEYELNNKNKYEVYRDFKKKNPKIFNENMEDISKEFNIDKNKGNQFFYEQTNVDEELFLSTLIVGQTETKLRKTRTKHISPKNSKFSRYRK